MTEEREYQKGPFQFNPDGPVEDQGFQKITSVTPTEPLKLVGGEPTPGFTQCPMAEVLRSKVSDAEIIRRVELVDKHNKKIGKMSSHTENRLKQEAASLTLGQLAYQAERLWTRHVIAALLTIVGQPVGVRIPPRPRLIHDEVVA